MHRQLAKWVKKMIRMRLWIHRAVYTVPRISESSTLVFYLSCRLGCHRELSVSIVAVPQSLALTSLQFRYACREDSRRYSYESAFVMESTPMLLDAESRRAATELPKSDCGSGPAKLQYTCPTKCIDKPTLHENIHRRLLNISG